MSFLSAMLGLGWAAQMACISPVAEKQMPASASCRVMPRDPPSWTLLWRQPTVRTGQYRHSRETFGQPAISERHRCAIVATAEGDVIAYGLDSAAELWRFKYGSTLETTPYLVSVGGNLNRAELVVLGTRNNTLLALDVATGGLVWQTDLDGELRAAPRLCQGVLVASTSANKVSVIAPANGEVIWSHGRPAPTGLSIDGHARVGVGSGRVFASFSDGFAAAYALEDGELLWSRPLSLRGASFVDADADPAVFEDRVIMASYSDGIYALGVDDGHTLWNRPAQAVSTLQRAGSRLLAGSADGWIESFDAEDGATKWRTQLGATPLSRLIVEDQKVYLSAGNLGLITLNLQHGRPTQASDVHERVVNDLAVSKRHLAFLSASGHLYMWQRASNEDVGHVFEHGPSRWIRQWR